MEIDRKDGPASRPLMAGSPAEGFRSDIEGLRALAVVMVVAFHAGLSALSGGFIGVDVFFVISGYLITSLLLSEIARTGCIDLRAFYARRVRRLLPTAFVVLFVTLLVGGLMLSPLEVVTSGKSAVATSLYGSNVWFMRQTADYFAPESALNPFLHTWSLAVEEQFYFVWPVLLLLVMRYMPRRLPVVLFVVGLASLALCLVMVDVKQSFAFYASPTRAWEFAVGAIACLIPRASLATRPRLVRMGGWLGFALVLGSGFLLSEATPFPSWSALLPVFGAAAMLLAGQNDTRWLVPLSWRPMRYLGSRSYAIYLWHWPIIVLALIAWPHMGAWERVGLALASVAMAEISYRLVEHPIRIGPPARMRPGIILIVALIVTALSAGLGVATVVAGRHLGAERGQAAISLAQSLTSRLPETCVVSLSVTRVKTCDFAPTAGGAGGLGAPGVPVRRIVLFGDSHAAQWFTPVSTFASRDRAVLTTVLKSSCPPARITAVSSRLRRSFTECSTWRRAALDRIITLRPDLVVLSEHSNSYVRRADVAVTAPSTDAQGWGEGLAATVQALSRAGIATVVLSDTPTMNFNVPTCLGRKARGVVDRPCEVARPLAMNMAAVLAERAAVADAALTRYLDVSVLFCSGAICLPTMGGTVLYKDANHISEVGARRVAPAVIDALTQAEREVGGRTLPVGRP
ncbi:acyltransferase family protein [soil metagenome]